MKNNIRKPRKVIKSVPRWLSDLEKKLNKIDPEWFLRMKEPEGGVYLSERLPKVFEATKVGDYGTYEREIWDKVGAFFRASQRFHDAIAIYSSMYSHLLMGQLANNQRIHKGAPLVWLADSYANLGNNYLSKKYLMLTLIEDAITYEGKLDTIKTGSYFRLAWRHGLSDIEIKRYAEDTYKISCSNPEFSIFPEYILQELDKNWMVEFPSPDNISLYISNTIYIQFLCDRLGDGTGKALERLADYVLSCIPGCRTAQRKRSFSTDYDIVCSLEGPDIDFRSGFGRYFVCECKDWDKPADFTTFAKFSRVLDSIKAKFGILVSKDGLTGTKSTTDAVREQLKVYQDRGMIIIVVDEKDLKFISEGGNFVSLMRNKYEKIRLDLRE
jgi:hypothetical protein